MFVDASAIVAILTREPEDDPPADVLESAESPITSPIAIFEAALGICRKRHASVEEAEQDVGEWTLTEAATRASQRDVALSLAHERLATRPRSALSRRFLRHAEAIAG